MVKMKKMDDRHKMLLNTLVAEYGYPVVLRMLAEDMQRCAEANGYKTTGVAATFINTAATMMYDFLRRSNYDIKESS